MKLNQYKWTKEKLEKLATRRHPKWPNIRLRDDGKLVYVSNLHGEKGKERVIIPEEAVDRILAEAYVDTSISRNGRDSFWHNLSDRYVGISRRRVDEFLKQQASKQQIMPIKHAVAKPIISKSPLERWQIDLVNMSNIKGHNGQYSWILTCIDCFSKFAYGIPLFMKSARHVRATLEALFNREVPKILQSDNGAEFVNREVRDLLNDLEIVHITSGTYSPQSNGQIERFNKTLKSMLWAYFKRENTYKWRSILPTIINNYNNSYHETIKAKPIDIHGGKRIQTTLDHIEDSARESLSDAPDDIRKGDHVRIVALSKAVDRKMEKARFRKHYVKNYSKAVYEIESVSRARTAIRGIEYRLLQLAENDDGEWVRSDEPKHLDKVFHRHQLFKIPRV